MIRGNNSRVDEKRKKRNRGIRFSGFTISKPSHTYGFSQEYAQLRPRMPTTTQVCPRQHKYTHDFSRGVTTTQEMRTVSTVSRGTCHEQSRSTPTQRRRLQKVPAARPMAGEGRERENEAFRGLGLLGKAESQLRRSERQASSDRTCTSSARRKSDGAHVHRRPEWRLALSCFAQSGIRKSTHFRFPR